MRAGLSDEAEPGPETAPHAGSQETTARATLAVLTGTGLAALLALLYNAWCGRLLGMTQYADLASALAMISVLTYALNPLALATAQVAAQLAARADLPAVRALYLAMRRRTLLILALLAVALLPILPLASKLFRFSSASVPLLAFLVFSVTPFLAIARVTIRSLHRFSSYATGSVSEAVLRIAVGIPLVWGFRGAVHALVGYAVSSAAVFAVHDRSLRRLSAGSSAAPSLPGATLSGASGLMFAYAIGQNVDLLSLKVFTAGSAAGAYAAAWTLARGLTALTTPVDAVLLPRLAVAASPASALLRAARLFALLWSVPLLATIVFPDLIVRIVFGRGWEAAAAALPWLALAAMFLSLNYVSGQVLLYFGRNGFLATFAVGLVAEVALVIWAGGDLLLTARSVAAAHAAISVANLVWLAQVLRAARSES